MKIAIDGHSSCGKSTLAKSLAKKFDFLYIDTGAMYRTVTLYAQRNGILKDGNLNELALKSALKNIKIEFKRVEGALHSFLNGEDVESEIRKMEVSRYVSQISAVGFVREEMVLQQRSMSENSSVVMDGRDIGTVVFPDAELKIFVTASPEIRAMRRFKELQSKGDNVSYDEIFQNLQLRDLQDSSRTVAPLKKADDAILLDNSNMTIDQQFDFAVNLVENLIKKE